MIFTNHLESHSMYLQKQEGKPQKAYTGVVTPFQYTAFEVKMPELQPRPTPTSGIVFHRSLPCLKPQVLRI